MKIIIVGSSMVGQVTGRGLLVRGHQVTFLDQNPAVVAELKREGLSAHIVDTNGWDYGRLAQYSDIIMICVDTPPDPENKTVDLENIQASTTIVGQMLRENENGPVVAIRSSVPPMTTENMLIPLLEEVSGLVAGQDFGVCVNPVFLRPNRAADDFAHPLATVIGELNWASGNVLERLYRPFGGKLFRTTLVEAELTKYISNLRDALVISFNNEMWLLGQKLDVDTDLATYIATYTSESAWNPQYGSTGGYPFNDDQLPNDITTMIRVAGEMSHKMPLLEAMRLVNDEIERADPPKPSSPAETKEHNWEPAPELPAGSKGLRGAINPLLSAPIQVS